MNNKKMFFSWFLVLAWMSVIFMFSSQNGDDSGQLSGSIVDVVVRVFAIVGIKIANIDFVVFVVRKGAHMFIFFVLALFTLNAFFNSRLRVPKGGLWLLSVLVCFLYAISDEFHQSFSPGRVMSAYDVMIDTLGASIGASAYLLARTWILKHIKKDYQS